MNKTVQTFKPIPRYWQPVMARDYSQGYYVVLAAGESSLYATLENPELIQGTFATVITPLQEVTA